MLHLAPNVFLVPVRNRAVALDLMRDKYIALNADMAKAAFELIGAENGGEAAERPDLLAASQTLLRQGILTDRQTDTARIGTKDAARTPVETRWPTTRWEGRKRPSLGAALAVMWALAQVSLALRFQPFHKIIARISGEAVRRRDRAPAKTEQEVLDEYVVARPWFPIKPICRLDAPALCLYLRRNGHDADLVFGVTLGRFAAHCWVQCADRVMKEPCESIAGYSPIMVA